MTSLTYIPNEFERFDAFVPGIGTITSNGMDAEVIDEIKAVGAWEVFRRNIRTGMTTCAQFFPRGDGRVSLFLFVGEPTQGGFISLTANDSILARAAMLRMAEFFFGRPRRRIDWEA